MYIFFFSDLQEWSAAHTCSRYPLRQVTSSACDFITTDKKSTYCCDLLSFAEASISSWTSKRLRCLQSALPVFGKLQTKLTNPDALLHAIHHCQCGTWRLTVYLMYVICKAIILQPYQVYIVRLIDWTQVVLSFQTNERYSYTGNCEERKPPICGLTNPLNYVHFLLLSSAMWIWCVYPLLIFMTSCSFSIHSHKRHTAIRLVNVVQISKEHYVYILTVGIILWLHVIYSDICEQNCQSMVYRALALK